MNVILLEKVGRLGNVGDTASVKSGYARNFLFPFGKAIPATQSNLKNFEERRAELMAAHNEKVATAQKRAEKLKELQDRLNEYNITVVLTGAARKWLAKMAAAAAAAKPE